MTDPPGARPTPTVPPGWFVDPGDPARMRWWTGTDWSTKSHRPARTWGIYPPSYIQSFWIGENRAALFARILVSIGWIAFIFVLVALPVSAALPTTELSTIVVLLLTLAGITAPAGLVSAIVALRRSRRLGAFGTAIWSTVLGSIVTLFAGAWLIGWIALGVAGAVSP